MYLERCDSDDLVAAVRRRHMAMVVSVGSLAGAGGHGKDTRSQAPPRNLAVLFCCNLVCWGVMDATSFLLEDAISAFKISKVSLARAETALAKWFSRLAGRAKKTPTKTHFSPYHIKVLHLLGSGVL